ncbi:hypothetical protein RINTHM_8900 [Richelia intracellularis HM01]|nr:hypothetical protein RINTHM_8900 [Richelia intracellularis HM01]
MLFLPEIICSANHKKMMQHNLLITGKDCLAIADIKPFLFR